MVQEAISDVMLDDNPIDVSSEVNFIWSIANKLRGTYSSDKYKDVIIPMTIIRRFECALAPTKDDVLKAFKKNPKLPKKSFCRISGFQFYNTSEYTLEELCNDPDHLAANFNVYIQGFSPNIQEILLSSEKGLDFSKEIDKMDAGKRLLPVVKAFSELDLDPRTIDNVKMGYIFEELIRKFSENASAGDHYTGRDIIKTMVNILLAEGCDDLFDPGKAVTILDRIIPKTIQFHERSFMACGGKFLFCVNKALFLPDTQTAVFLCPNLHPVSECHPHIVLAVTRHEIRQPAKHLGLEWRVPNAASVTMNADARKRAC